MKTAFAHTNLLCSAVLLTLSGCNSGADAKQDQEIAALHAATQELQSKLAQVEKDAAAAQSSANQAMQASQASQSCCDATNEKFDRQRRVPPR